MLGLCGTKPSKKMLWNVLYVNSVFMGDRLFASYVRSVEGNAWDIPSNVCFPRLANGLRVIRLL